MNIEHSILIDEEKLTENYIPKKLIHREEQIKEIIKCLKPALKNRPVENLFLLGTSGTGKTIVIKKILNKHFKDNSVYVNCWKHRTTYEVLKEILLTLKIPIHGREPTGELIKKMEKRNKINKIIVCLDEVDRIKNIDLLYILARENLGIVLASTSYHSLLKLTARIKRSLSITEVEFPAYSVEEIYDILTKRVKCAFRPRAITNSQIRLISLAANGDIRVGIEILSKAGKKAEKRQLKEITFKEIEEVIFEVNRLYNLYPIHELNEHQKTILRILERYKKIQSGRLYKEYVKLVSNPVVDRSYRKYMEKMNEMELIKSEGKGRWRRYTLNI